jgi:hypothetical protein
MRLVVDSSAALRAGMSAVARRAMEGHELLGPPLLWSEVYSAVHQAVWRRELDDRGGRALLSAFEALGTPSELPPA